MIKEFLLNRGLELSEEKTLITEIEDGVDFLGFNIRKYDGVLNIKPSKKSISNVVDKTREIIHRAAAWKQEDLIRALNPVTIGWSNYFKGVVSSKAFSDLDNIRWNQLWSWSKRRHNNKGRKWIASKYWHSIGNRNWDFSADNQRLRLFSQTKIKRHYMVKLDANPYLDREYFLNRNRIENSKSEFQTKLTFFPNSCPNKGL